MVALAEREVKSHTLVDRVMSYDLTRIKAKFCYDEGASEGLANELEVELKRFLILCALNPSQPYGMRGIVDKLWHTFILFTKEYHGFTTNILGKFIHHVPELPHDTDRQKSLVKYSSFLRDYEELFREQPPAHIWPRVSKSTDDTNDCGECNGCAPAPGPATGNLDCSGCGGCSGPG